MEYADGDCADSAEAHPGFYCKVALQLLIALYSGALYFKSPSTRMSRDAYGLDGVRCMADGCHAASLSGNLNTSSLNLAIDIWLPS